MTVGNKKSQSIILGLSIVAIIFFLAYSLDKTSNTERDTARNRVVDGKKKMPTYNTKWDDEGYFISSDKTFLIRLEAHNSPVVNCIYSSSPTKMIRIDFNSTGTIVDRQLAYLADYAIIRDITNNQFDITCNIFTCCRGFAMHENPIYRDGSNVIIESNLGDDYIYCVSIVFLD